MYKQCEAVANLVIKWFKPQTTCLEEFPKNVGSYENKWVVYLDNQPLSIRHFEFIVFSTGLY